MNNKPVDMLILVTAYLDQDKKDAIVPILKANNTGYKITKSKT